jgi:uncharacterized membrane protein (DUF106 family)
MHQNILYVADHHHYRKFPNVVNFLFLYLLTSIYCSDVLDNILVINLISDA